MGLGGEFLRRMVDLSQRGALHNLSAVVEIGAQQLANTFLENDAALDELYSISRRERISLGKPLGGTEDMTDGSPSSRDFWQSLGFRYACIDLDGHRDSFALDLNKDEAPAEFRGAFDLVVNAGTTEHVANQDNAFRVIHDLCKPGGIMIHEVPAGGMLNHGLFNYNMRFFWHLCGHNHYKPLYLRLAAYKPNPLPQNIIDSNSRHAGDGELIDCMIPDLVIFAAFRKVSKAPFSTPLDIPVDLIRR